MKDTLKAVWLWLLRVPQCTDCGLCCAPHRWCGPFDNALQFVDIKRDDVQRMRNSERRDLLAPIPGGGQRVPGVVKEARGAAAAQAAAKAWKPGDPLLPSPWKNN